MVLFWILCISRGEQEGRRVRVPLNTFVFVFLFIFWGKGQTEKGTGIQSGLTADSSDPEPHVRLIFTNHEIMT